MTIDADRLNQIRAELNSPLPNDRIGGVLTLRDEVFLLAALDAAEQERDDYRFWNERVRTCERHTQDVAAPVGDCLICNIEAAEARATQATNALRELLDGLGIELDGEHFGYIVAQIGRRDLAAARAVLAAAAAEANP